jgi:hypothetical protein
MKRPGRIALSFVGLTASGLVAGGLFSAIVTTFLFKGEGTLVHNLGWSARTFPVILFVLTLGLPVSLSTIPWLAWPSVAGFCVWALAGVLSFRGQLRLSYRLAFGGATAWAIILVPAAKMLSSV